MKKKLTPKQRSEVMKQVWAKRRADALAKRDAFFADMQEDQTGVTSLMTGTNPTHDPVNHPTHYTSHPSGVECITVTEHMNFNLGNAIKYIWRSGDKGNMIEDLKKAKFYLEREIERVEK